MRMWSVLRIRRRRVLDEGEGGMGWDVGEKDALFATIEEMMCFKLNDLIEVPPIEGRTWGEVQEVKHSADAFIILSSITK